MVNLIRRFQQPLMVAITVIVIIAFVWLYNNSGHLDRVGSDQVGTIYGRKISQTEFLRHARKFEICRDLRLIDLLESLAGPAMTLDQATENFIWNSVILKHEADALGVVPTEEEIERFVKELPVFQTRGQYDSTKYITFIQQSLSPRGFTEEQLFDLVRDDLRLRKLKELLGTTADPAPADVRTAYEQRNQKTEASVVRLKLADIQAATQVSDEDVKKAYEERKSSLNSEEKRKVRYVAFTLANQDKPVVGKERIEALQKLADQAQEFAVAMTDKNTKLEDAAAKFNAKVAESPEFTASQPPSELSQSEQVVEAAFRLTKEEPNSDAISADNGYYVLQLADIIPSKPLTLEEAKAQLTQQLKNDRAQETLNLKATEIRNKMDAELKAGKALAEAAQAAGVTLEQFPAFSLVAPDLTQPDAREIITAAIGLNVGQLSEFIPTSAGGALVYINNRQPVDEAAFAKEKDMIAQSLARNLREGLFREWLKGRRAAANIHTARG